MRRYNIPFLLIGALALIVGYGAPAISKAQQRAPLFDAIAIAPITIAFPSSSERPSSKTEASLRTLSDTATAQAEKTAKDRGITASVERITPDEHVAPAAATGRPMLSGRLRLPVDPSSRMSKLYDRLGREGVTAEVLLQDASGSVVAQASVTIHSANIRWMSGTKVKRLVYRRDAYEIVARKAVNGAVKELARQLSDRAEASAEPEKKPGEQRP